MNNHEIGKIKSLALRDFLWVVDPIVAVLLLNVVKFKRAPIICYHFHFQSTYDELKFYPGDNLNIIIGPNGTGKSTIVAAIILGCGGEPVLLSRSKDVRPGVSSSSFLWNWI